MTTMVEMTRIAHRAAMGTTTPTAMVATVIKTRRVRDDYHDGIHTCTV